jgi:sortase A
VAVLQDAARLPRVGLRKFTRVLGIVLIAAGLLTGIWVLVVWQWKDPFTSIYTWWEQRHLVSNYDERVHEYRTSAPPPREGASPAAVREVLARAAARYRRTTQRGDALGRLEVPRLGLNMIVVDGTDADSLSKGPGLDRRTFMPGEGKLSYVAGHRTTYLAPFANIDSLRAGDPLTFSLPYGVFHYRITGHVIVPADDLSRLRSRRYEQLALQACHPRFFATHRYIAYARPKSVTLTNGHTYRLWH